MSLQLVALLWLLSAPWDFENVTVRGFADPPDKRTVPQQEYPLQPASVTPFPDQPPSKVKRQPAQVGELDAATMPVASVGGDPPPKKQWQAGAADTQLKLHEPRVALSGTPAEQLEQLLEQPVTLRVDNATIDDVLTMLRATLPANILLDRKALEEAAFEDKTLFEASVPTPLKLRQALDLLLGPVDLGFICEHESLLVTNRIVEENHPVTIIYDVGDLLREPGVEHQQDLADYDSLINMITASVKPTTWKTYSGPPPGLNPFEPAELLVIEQTRRGHEEIAKLLTELRRGRGLKIPETLKIAPPAVNLAQQQEPLQKTAATAQPIELKAPYCKLEFADAGLSAEILKNMKPAEKLEYQLRRRGLIRIKEAKLEDLVKELADKMGVNVVIDKKALEEAAFDTATPLESSANAATRLSGSLRMLLRNYGLSYIADEETLLITTMTAQENTQLIRYYAVGEFIRPLGSSPNLGGADFDAIIQLIQSTIQPTTWKANGGQGDVAPQEVLDILVISNTWEVHEQLEEFFAQLRKIHAAKAETIRANEATLQRAVYQLVLPRQENIKETVDKGDVIQREIIRGELQYSMDDLIEMIKKTIEPASWDGEKHKIDALGESLIVTHSQATQRKLHELLHDLGITEAQHRPLQQHGYGQGAFGGGGGAGGGGGGGFFSIGSQRGPVGRSVGPQPSSNNAPRGAPQSGGIF